MKDKWIKRIDREPEDGQRVLGFQDFTLINKKYQGVETFYYREGIGMVYNINDDDPHGLITYWMPYEPPEKD